MADDGFPQDQRVPAKSSRDLNDAISSCFSPFVTAPPFPQRLSELTQALTNSQSVAVWTIPKEDEHPALLTRNDTAQSNKQVLETVHQYALDQEAAQVKFSGGLLLAKVCLPDDTQAILSLSLPQGGATAQSLAYERVSMLSQLSAAHYRNADVAEQTLLAENIQDIAAGKTNELQNLADRLSRMSGADFAAVALWRRGALSEFKISGQENFTKRAILPDKLKSKLKETAQQKLKTQTRYFASAPSQDDGLVLILEEPKRGSALLPLTAAFYGQSDHQGTSRRSYAKLWKSLAIAAGVVAIGFIPIPDGVSINATTEATNKRIITAPLTGVLQAVEVEEGARLNAGAPILRLDTQDVDLELTGLQSERASAVLERESARFPANAAALKNAELTVEKLDSRIALLEQRKESATITASIAGVAVLKDLRQRVGSTVRQGETLMEISDPSKLGLELSILEADIGKLAQGDIGKFRPDFDPTTIYRAQIQSISPAIEFTADIPAAPAWATFDETVENLRPGLTGVLQVG